METNNYPAGKKVIKNHLTAKINFAPVVFCLAFLTGISFTAFSQNGVKIAAGSGTAHASAMLDVESVVKGALLPRMTAAQRTAIGSPATGLIVYQTDGVAGFYSFNGSVWSVMGAGGGDNLGNHIATTTLNMNANVVDETRRLEFYGEGGNSGEGANSYAIFQEGGGWSGPYPDLRIAFHTGIKLGAHYSYNGIRFYNNSDMVTQLFSVGDGDQNVRIYNDISTVGDIFATQNYGKGLVGVYSSTNYQNVFAMGPAYRLPANGASPGNLYGLAWTHENVGGQSRPGLGHQLLAMSNGGTTAAMGNGFWTQYGVDAGSSGTYNRFRTWTELTGAHGLYSGVNGAHWYPNNGSYGSWRSDGNRNGWAGTEYTGGAGNISLMIGLGGWGGMTTGMHANSYGWLWRFEHQRLWADGMTDVNDGGYYCDPNSTSRMYYGDYNYLHTQVNDSWFPYTGNNWNYLRGNSYITNAHWYDENNTGYYFNVDNTSRMAYIYQGIGAYNVGGWTSGRIQTESQNDGHQYHPSYNAYGYIGISGQSWWYHYAYNHVSGSERSLKRNITPVDNSLSAMVMEDIDKLKPSFYKFKEETDEMQKGNEAKYRPNMHLGLILDETPDYLQDQAFSGVDIYSLATLGIAGVKNNHEEIKKIKQTISDFGNSSLQGNDLWVPFSDEFIQKNGVGVIPVVTVTANRPGVTLSVTETTTKGFRVVRSGDASATSFNWITMANTDINKQEKPASEISASLFSQLKVDEGRKAPIKAFWAEQNRIGHEEHAKQAAEHERVVAVGKKNLMDTKKLEGPKTQVIEGPKNLKAQPEVDPKDIGAAPVHNPTPVKAVPAPPDDVFPVIHQKTPTAPENDPLVAPRKDNK